jgi:hypothetical protein
MWEEEAEATSRDINVNLSDIIMGQLYTLKERSGNAKDPEQSLNY